MSDYLIRYVLLNFICVFGAFVLLAFMVIRFREEKYGTVAACSVMVLVCISTIMLSRSKKVSQIVPAVMLMVFYALLCIVVTYLGEAYGSNFLFVYVYPPLTIMLLGMRFGVIFSIALPCVICAEMIVPWLSRYNYPLSVPLHMIVTYSLVFAVMVVVEITRKAKDSLISSQNQKLTELREAAEAANKTKSNFLANMSHEIRTPMNAITGMAELLLRGELPGESRGFAEEIKQAASHLVSIINGILDFSKIEAGKLEIVPVKYLLSSLINDVASIIRMRLVEKPVRFYTNIDGNIPNSLVGDEVRLRQILLNLLSNAAKYTSKGHFGVSIIETRRTEEQVWLEITITDTGAGIRQDDLASLFKDFVQVDSKKNRGIDGTGLGLAISKRLCDSMGGRISVKSEYGKGSTFTVIVPQVIDCNKPFAFVEEPEKKKVLVYERRSVYSTSLQWSFDKMKVPHTIVNDKKDFEEALFREEWFYVFSGHGLYDKIKPLMERPDNDFFGGRKPLLALLVECGIETSLSNVRIISLPVHSLSIANILNGSGNNKDYFASSETYGVVRFTLPNVRVLVVDDIEINLEITEALLAPYKMTVDTCLRGADAIKLIKRREYDLIFMDHMMPEMDGIETTAAIRSWETMQIRMGNSRSVPIIALTANAMTGMKETFLEKGFNDFLAKPVDISKLDEIICRWIPKEKREGGKAESDQ